jgi:hypothetical protein
MRRVKHSVDKVYRSIARRAAGVCAAPQRFCEAECSSRRKSSGDARQQPAQREQSAKAAGRHGAGKMMPLQSGAARAQKMPANDYRRAPCGDAPRSIARAQRRECFSVRPFVFAVIDAMLKMFHPRR